MKVIPRDTHFIQYGVTSTTKNGLFEKRGGVLTNMQLAYQDSDAHKTRAEKPHA